MIIIMHTVSSKLFQVHTTEQRATEGAAVEHNEEDVGRLDDAEQW